MATNSENMSLDVLRDIHTALLRLEKRLEESAQFIPNSQTQRNTSPSLLRHSATTVPEAAQTSADPRGPAESYTDAISKLYNHFEFHNTCSELASPLSTNEQSVAAASYMGRGTRDGNQAEGIDDSRSVSIYSHGSSLLSSALRLDLNSTPPIPARHSLRPQMDHDGLIGMRSTRYEDISTLATTRSSDSMSEGRHSASTAPTSAPEDSVSSMDSFSNMPEFFRKAQNVGSSAQRSLSKRYKGSVESIREKVRSSRADKSSSIKSGVLFVQSSYHAGKNAMLAVPKLFTLVGRAMVEQQFKGLETKA